MVGLVNDNKYIYLDNVSDEVNQLLYNHFSAEPPGRRYIDTEQYGWDGFIRRYDNKRQRLALPFLEELKGICKKEKIPFRIIDERKKPKFPPPPPEAIGDNWLNGIKLDDHQLRALKSCCKHDIGIHHHPTGAGKTEMIAGIAKMFRCPTVIIAEQRIVIEQIKERLELRDIFDNNTKVGLFYGGSTPDGQLIVVGSINSLMSPPGS